MDGNVIEGKAFWSWIHEPNISSNPEWSLRIVPSEIEQQRFKKAGYKMQMEQINNKDFGLSIFIRRKVKHMDDVLERPLLFDKDKKKLGIEKIKGSPVSDSFLEYSFRLGILFVASLMVFAIFNDIVKII